MARGNLKDKRWESVTKFILEGNCIILQFSMRFTLDSCLINCQVLFDNYAAGKRTRKSENRKTETGNTHTQAHFQINTCKEDFHLGIFAIKI